MIPVIFLNFCKTAPYRGYWDQTLLEKMLKDGPFDVLHDKDVVEDNDCYYYPNGKAINSAIVIIPGSQNVDDVDRINEYISKLSGVLLIITGDEEHKMNTHELKHRNMKLWLMNPQSNRYYNNVDKFIGEGFTPHIDLLPNEAPDKNLRWFFSGQNTHSRRQECIKQLRRISDGELHETKGFTQGMSRLDYINKMASAKVIPCPSGPTSPDTFRVYESLESGCIPIVDGSCPIYLTPGYWQMIFGEDIPFPIVLGWHGVEDLINYYNDTFPINSNRVFAWWQMYKRNLAIQLVEDYQSISNDVIQSDEITVVIPTSPIKSNPDTSIIDETISTIRVHHPDAEIIITFDGIRPEQEERRADYEEYKRLVLWKCNRVWKRVVPIVFDSHMHQVAMLRETLKYVRTDKILYVEHDTPLTPDMAIEWSGIFKMIDTGIADLVRFHFEAFIPKEHEYMMIDKSPQVVHGVSAVRTIQWSQRPHVASVEFYKRILSDHFTPDARTFIEDKMHGVVVNAWKREQLQGWNKFKLWIYHPEGGNIKRSYHTDGRGSEIKYDMKF